MSRPIVIIGSGFAALQVVKMLHRSGCTTPIKVITSSDGSEYNKPDLSHVFSKQQKPEELVLKTASELSSEYGVKFTTNTRVKTINPDLHVVETDEGFYSYSKLVLATGANTFVPTIKGIDSKHIATLNSLEEYSANKDKIEAANRITIVGGGLIGVELAVDLAKLGKEVSIIEPAATLLSNLIPEFVENELVHHLEERDIDIYTDSALVSVNANPTGLAAITSHGKMIATDIILSAAGIKPNTELAKQAGIEVNRGIVVSDKLETSAPDVFAIGDCAEINGRVMAFLQPAVMSATVLAKQLLGYDGSLNLPNMLVKVKTPEYPIQLAGVAAHMVYRWQADIKGTGIMARGYDEKDKLIGFVCTGEQAKLAFPMLRELNVN
ncbi:NADH:flavorubredoxin reductase NorW [Vibrio sp. SCSIO 43140]|uniref:NADH:flavorubredoxin reductase NorW n=1 Tax=Vibrio sp. SCSIO 43140 TaxID=2819100 RepID=UPI002075E681|nr:NADH:flavorubredoxin reductase NorW [Vibrio sp. SCSIO 43140]USD58785.1 NADH:flavorubredoxin reductase NorW [Vibrio sp. SCSIO 43140]USD59119.1 NADH:flavorubredoxin reductase NorW [Vibrio sp. SCSIO 43140]USD59728.1 NADH:flavorubredoxin reductase NorW [Vibrio sp. SCSIO 43140]